MTDPGTRTTQSSLPGLDGPKGSGSLVRSALTAASAALVILVIGYHHGGYELPATGEIAIGAAWILLVGAMLGLVPAVRPDRLRGAAMALPAMLTAWMLISLLWSQGSERTVAAAVQMAAIAVVLSLLVLVVRRRDRKALVAGVAGGIALTAGLSVCARLAPSLFSEASVLASDAGHRSRSFWPLGYWNALGFFCAMGLPLLAHFASESKRSCSRAVAAFAFPVVVLCVFFTISRGGIITSGVGLLVGLALGPLSRRVIATHALLVACSVAVVVPTLGSSELMDQLNGSGRSSGQATTVGLLLLASATIAAGLAILIGRVRSLSGAGSRPPQPRRRIATAAGGLAVLLIVFSASGGIPRAVKTFDDFKSTETHLAPGRGNTIDRLAATSSNGRWQLWQGAINAGNEKPISGQGAGMFELWWVRHGSAIKVRNAHSLFAEIYAELGLVGLAMIICFVAVMAIACIRAFRNAGEDLGLVAAGSASLLVFVFSTAGDWSWQETVIPLAAMFLLAALMAPERKTASQPSGPWRAGTACGALAVMALVIPPTVASNSIYQSRAEALRGDLPNALAHARSATAWQPYSATAWRQQALVLDAGGRPSEARASALKATEEEPGGWQNWFVLSEMDARMRMVTASIRDFRRARDLNPNSAMFKPTN